MTDKTINLLQPEELAPAEKKRAFFLKIGTIFLIVFYCLTLVGIFSFGLVVQREYKVVVDKIKLERAKLSDLQEVELLQLFLKQRLASLAKVIEIDGLEPKYWLGYFDELVSEGVAFENTEWSSSGQVVLSGVASNAVVLADFLDSLKKAADEQKIASSTLVSATREEEGTYNFSLEIDVKGQPE